jgi:hypothetical protein
VVAVKVHDVFFAATLSKRAIIEAGEGGQRAREDKRLPERWVEGAVGAGGPECPEPGKGHPKNFPGLGVVSLLLQSVHLHA